MIVLGALQAFAFLIVVAWSYCGVSLTFFPRVAGWTYTAFHELRPFFIPSAILFYLPINWTAPTWAWAVGVVASFLAWPVFRGAGGDDDRWKRRRLAVVPTSTGGQS